MHVDLELIGSSDSDPVTTDLISLDALKLELGITGTTQDALLQARITRESLAIAEECERQFAFSNAIETFTFDENEVPRASYPLWLSLYPVEVIDLLTVDGAELTQDVDFRLDARNGRVWRIGGTWAGVVAVTYGGGYRLPDAAPARLQQACIQSVTDRDTTSDEMERIREITHGPETSSVGFYQNKSAGSGLSQGVLDLLETYRRPSFA